MEVTLQTSKGEIVVELFPDKAPQTVNNFASYVANGFYDNTLFHRVVPDFVVQGGGFGTGMKAKVTQPAIANESLNGLNNERGTIAMARKRAPDSATSQFYFNLADNSDLDPRGSQFGYTVFGKVISGMDAVDLISAVPSQNTMRAKNVPIEDVVLLSAKLTKGNLPLSKSDSQPKALSTYIAGQHYIMLANPVATTTFNAVEVVEVFSYGCQHCYTFEKLLTPWTAGLDKGVQFKKSPAIWNGLMRLFAHTYYTIEQQPQAQQLHQKLFDQIVLDGRPLLSESMIGLFFSENGVDEQSFAATFDSKQVINQVALAEARVKNFEIDGIPALIVNGKYRVTAESAGGQKEMLQVVDYLIKKEKGA